MNIDQIRARFPATRHWTYLNHAGVSPISTNVRDAMGAFINDVTEHGSGRARKWAETCMEARRLTAQLIHAEPSEIAFVKNTSEGLSFVANGMDWRPGDNVVTANREFPANVYPWLNLRDRGVETRFVEEKEGRIFSEDIERAIDARTRVVSLSTVEFASGFRNDVEAIGALCAERNVLFVVDMIQSLGALTLDVKRCKIGAASAGAHKWLSGPEGIGIFYCAKAAMEQIKVTEAGWANVTDAHAFLSYDLTFRPDAQRFECGSLAPVLVYGLKAALDLIAEVGIQAIEERVLMLTDRLCERVKEKRGYRVFSSRRAREKSGIVIIVSEHYDSQTLHKALLEKRILTAPRGGGVRVSPHYYNTEEELDRVIEALP